MATQLAPSLNSSFAAGALDATVAQLCETREVNGRTVIHMPVATSSGGGVSVSVWHEGGGTFMVSDDGTAYHAVITAAASERIFSGVARDACARYGATFDGQSMLFIRVAQDRLKGAIIAMASLVKEVVDKAIERSFEARIESEREDFVRRVADAFTPAAVQERAVVVGSSTTAHEFDAVVTVGGRALAFDFFTRSHSSVSSAFLKLADIARLDAGPRPIGVTPSLEAVGPKLLVLSSVAAVIEARTSSRRLRSLAA